MTHFASCQEEVSLVLQAENVKQITKDIIELEFAAVVGEPLPLSGKQVRIFTSNFRKGYLVRFH